MLRYHIGCCKGFAKGKGNLQKPLGQMPVSIHSNNFRYLCHMHNSLPIKKYFALRKELDKLCSELSALHAPHMNCREGCSECCMDFSIFPVEYHAIKYEAGDLLKQGSSGIPSTQCPFLAHSKCIIYKSRPIICRTQGLPLLFMNDDNWELSFCELNFKEFNQQEFNFGNTLSQDRFNSRLYMINQAFLEELPGKSYVAGELIPLKNLRE